MVQVMTVPRCCGALFVFDLGPETPWSVAAAQAAGTWSFENSVKELEKITNDIKESRAFINVIVLLPSGAGLEYDTVTVVPSGYGGTRSFATLYANRYQLDTLGYRDELHKLGWSKLSAFFNDKSDEFVELWGFGKS